MQYKLRCTLALFLFCETLLIQVKANPGNPLANKKWVVVIDAGHGGKDPGCHGEKYKEKDVALAVALKLGNYIQQNDKNIKVIYTRTTDVFIPLNERANIANRNHADFFICIHCNASPDKTKFGAATYVMGLYKAEGNLEVSKRENASILYEKDYKRTYNGFDPNSDEGNILFAMYQNIYLAQSLDLSAKIQKEYTTLAQRTDNGVKQAGFLVLWKTTMPSLLTEIGFLTNPKEENFIGSRKGQNKIAQCLFLALQQYIDEKEGVAFTSSAFNFTPDKPDSVVAKDSIAPVLDTTAQIIQTDTPKTSADTPDSAAQHASANTAKLKQSVQSLHPDTAISAPAKTPTVSTQTIQSKQDPPDSVANPIIKDSSNSVKIIYKVQIAISSKPLPPSDALFKNVQDIQMYSDKSIYKYTSGHFNSLDDAVKYQTQLRNSGFKDAFVVAFKNNTRVPIVRKK